MGKGRWELPSILPQPRFADNGMMTLPSDRAAGGDLPLPGYSGRGERDAGGRPQRDRPPAHPEKTYLGRNETLSSQRLALRSRGHS
ncbi:hypothetical protein DAETH_19030 [Deinococcus aetherius]|uniref:Uncharacterized protein n=1 Tax=Deinococcus aetherius TaxID=200252 RepID=A0ABN6RGZ9_9DEIO|nr:hypothetical protein DAETH_19030 [Deinococcus aetherius]